MPIVPILTGLAGVALAAAIVWDAFETILVPRRIGRKFRLTRAFYIVAWRLWRAAARAIRKPSRREALIGFFGPLSLILLLFCWAAGLIVAFALMAHSVERLIGSGHESFATLLYLSGETFFTLGFGDITPSTTFGRILAVAESGLGFGFLGTVVGYLPTMYAAFSQREIEISLMDARAGSPPTAAEFLRRSVAAGNAALCEDTLHAWERWAAQLLETHISYPQLAYYRSQHGNQSWLGSLLVILDATALVRARSDEGAANQAHATFAMARHALVDITQIFVPKLPPASPPRLAPEQRQAIRNMLAAVGQCAMSDDDFELRLAELRLLYEPYAQALAGYLMLELPPWIHAEPRRDNWERGPWDRLLPGTEQALRREEHF